MEGRVGDPLAREAPGSPGGTGIPKNSYTDAIPLGNGGGEGPGSEGTDGFGMSSRSMGLREDLPGCAPTLGSGRDLGIISRLFSGPFLARCGFPASHTRENGGSRKWPRRDLAGHGRPRTPGTGNSVPRPKPGSTMPKNALCASKFLLGRQEGRTPREELGIVGNRNREGFGFGIGWEGTPIKGSKDPLIPALPGCSRRLENPWIRPRSTGNRDFLTGPCRELLKSRK